MNFVSRITAGRGMVSRSDRDALVGAGPDWTAGQDGSGQRRLMNVRDPVRVEVDQREQPVVLGRIQLHGRGGEPAGVELVADRGDHVDTGRGDVRQSLGVHVLARWRPGTPGRCATR
mgnify:CR=1 FL=1